MLSSGWVEVHSKMMMLAQIIQREILIAHEGRKGLYEDDYVLQQAGQRACRIAVPAEIQPWTTLSYTSRFELEVGLDAFQSSVII